MSKLDEMLAQPLPKRKRPEPMRKPNVVAITEVPAEVLRGHAARRAAEASRRAESEIAAMTPQRRVGLAHARLERLQEAGADAAEIERARDQLAAAQAEWGRLVARAQAAVDWHGAQSRWHQTEAERFETIKLGLYSF
jgi:hypothetical protein